MRERLPLAILIMIICITVIPAAASDAGRFVPMHKIGEQIYCGACHPEQVRELNATTHLAYFAREIKKVAEGYGHSMSDEEAISAGCTMCHSYWNNFKGWGVDNFSIASVEIGDLNHGLGSQKSYVVKFGNVTPWKWGTGTKQNTTNSIKYTRLDAVWGNLSKISPGTAYYYNTNKIEGCGNAEKGICHIAKETAGMAAAGIKPEFQESYCGDGVFFTHEMQYSTSQYSAKPVKLCGACHVFKLPPMNDEGHPIEKPQSINYRAPDWAHQNVPCIRCHAHA